MDPLAPVRNSPVSGWLTEGLPILLEIVLLFVLTLVAVRLLFKVVTRLGYSGETSDLGMLDERQRRLRTLLGVAYTAGKAVIWLVAILMMLAALRINIAPVITGLGIGGIALAFGAQELVRDFFSGVFLLIDNQMRVGDVVEVAGVSGTVHRIDLRTTTLRSLDGSMHVIRNGQIGTVTNMTIEYSNTVLDLGADYSCPPDRVIAVIRETALTMAQDAEWSDHFLAEPTMMGLHKFEDAQITYRLLLKVTPSKQWEVGRELRRRLWYAYQEHAIPFPPSQQMLAFMPTPTPAVRGVEAPPT